MSQMVLNRSGLHHVQGDVDVAPGSIRVCTSLGVRGLHNGLCNFALQAGQADVKPRLEEVGATRIAEVNFGIDGCVRGQFNFHPAGYVPHRADKTSRPASGKQLLRIGTASWNSGSPELKI